MQKQTMEYQIHLHVVPNGTYGVAVFEDAAEAMVYFAMLITDLLCHPDIADVDWISDEHVHLLGHDGSLVGHAELISHLITLH